MDVAFLNLEEASELLHGLQTVGVKSYPHCSLSSYFPLPWKKVINTEPCSPKKLPLCENLCIIHIGDEYTFVCHQRLLHDHTNGYADAQQLHYVCIDEDLRSPTLVITDVLLSHHMCA